MDEKFKIIIMIKRLIDEYDNLTFNSKNESNVKDSVLQESYEILKITYIANDSYNKTKKLELQIMLLSKIKYLEYLTSKLNINEKEYNVYLFK